MIEKKITTKNKLKIYILGNDYALKSYMKLHKEILNKIAYTSFYSIELIIPDFKRRSILTIPKDFIYSFLWVNKFKPDYIVSVGPKVGFIFSLISIFNKFNLIHWYTGQKWALNNNPYLIPSFLSDLVIYFCAKYCFCDSKEQKEFIKKFFSKFSKKEIFCSPLGSINYVSDKLLNQGRNKLLTFKNNPVFKSKKMRVGFLGRICKEKGLEIIFKLSKEKILEENFKFLIRGPIDNNLSSHENLKIINFIDQCPNCIDIQIGYEDKLNFFTNIDIFILPSFREGFGSVAIEAQACGIPVICSSIYGLRSSVINGFSGIHCDKYNDYINALFGLLNYDLYKKYAKNSFEHASLYNKRSFSNDLLNLYKSKII